MRIAELISASHDLHQYRYFSFFMYCGLSVHISYIAMNATDFRTGKSLIDYN